MVQHGLGRPHPKRDVNQDFRGRRPSSAAHPPRFVDENSNALVAGTSNSQPLGLRAHEAADLGDGFAIVIEAHHRLEEAP